jgi:hypothetical protein
MDWHRLLLITFPITYTYIFKTDYSEMQECIYFNNKQMTANGRFRYVANACPNVTMQRNLRYTERKGVFPCVCKCPECRKKLQTKGPIKGVKP